MKFYKKEFAIKKTQLLEQQTQYDRLDAEFSNTRQRSHVFEEKVETLLIKNNTLQQSLVEAENGLLRSARKVGHYKMDLKALLTENLRLRKELALHITGDQKLKQELLISAQEGARLGGEDALTSNPALGAGFSQQYSANIADLSLTFWVNTLKNFDLNAVQHRVVNDISRTMTTAMFNYGRTRYGIGIPRAGVDKDARFRTMLETLTTILRNEQHEIYYKQLSRAIGTALYNTVDFIVNNSGL